MNKGNSKNIINFIFLYLFFTSIITPLILVNYYDNIYNNIPITIEDFNFGSVIEIFGLILAYLFFIFICHCKSNSIIDNIFINKNIEHLVVAISFLILLIASFTNFLMPVSYQAANEIGGNSSFFGSLGLSVYEPLMASVMISFVTLKMYRNKYDFYFYSSFVFLIIYSLAKVLVGGRSAILIILLPFLFRSLLNHGVFSTIKRLAPIALFFLIPFIVFINFLGQYRADAIIEDPFSLNLFMTNLYLRFSGITNSIFLSNHMSVDAIGSAYNAILGAPLTIVPRFFWPDKPISGSLDGTEFGLPYRIAAKLLGYDEWGNVVLAPFLVSTWLNGFIGFFLAILFMSFNAYIAYCLINKAMKQNSFILFSIGLYIIGLPHFTGFHVDYNSNISTFIRIIFLILIIFSLNKIKLFKK